MHGPTTYDYECVYIYIVQPFFLTIALKERVNHKLLIVINNIMLHYLLKKKKKKKHHTTLNNPSNVAIWMTISKQL